MDADDIAFGTAIHNIGRPRLIYADDHCIVVEGIRRLLSEEFDLITVALDGDSLLAAVRKHEPDVVVSDISMPGMNGIAVLKQLRSEGSRIPFVVLTMHAEPGLAATAMRAGANGYVVKCAAGNDLITAVRHALSGGHYVTPSIGASCLSSHLQAMESVTVKQREVLRLLGRGLRSKQVAADMGLSVRTVEAHKYTIMQILGVHSTFELLRRAETLGLLY